MHRRRKVEKKSCVTFLMCDPGCEHPLLSFIEEWYVDWGVPVREKGKILNSRARFVLFP